ncbi:PAS domain S-box protein [Thermodesulfobacteriota bacterium]
MQESESRYRALAEATPVPTCVHRGGKIIFANLAAVSLFGATSAQDLEGKLVLDRIHPDFRQRVLAAQKRVFDGGVVAPLKDMKFLKLDGTVIDVESLGTLIVYDGEQAIQAVFHDITVRKQAEEEILRSKILLESSIESPRDMIILSLDRKYRYLYFNKTHAESMSHVFGTRPQIGDCIFDHMTSKNDIEKVKEHYDRALAGEGHIAIEEYGEDQVRYSYEIRYNPVYGEKNEIIGITSFAQNITERKQEEEELWEKTHHLGERVKELNCLYGISNLVEKPDISLEEILVGTVALIPPSWQYPEITCSRIILDSKEYRTENYKETNWRQSSDILLNGERVGTVDVNYLEKRPEIDEGPFLKEERSLINVIAERMGRIIELIKTKEEKTILEAQLQQAQKIESIGTLAGGIAHDFNNILSPIMIHSDMVMEDFPSNSPLQFNLKEIFKAGERARDMVKQILAFGRQKQQERLAVRLGSILNEVLKLVRSTIPTTIDIRHNIEAKTDTVLADPTQIHQVILNLCTNASHAMREKGGVLEIKLDDLDLNSEAIVQFDGLTPGVYLRLTVRDTGHGIDPENIGKIFDPYFTTKQVGEGSGMGLAVVHGILKSHSGDIKVESEPGKGTTFQVLLPKSEADITPVEEHKIELPRGTERILFVDDEKPAVDIIKPMLEKLGHKVTARTSSIEALEAFRNNPEKFDLVITDMTMPNMTGKELAKELMQIRSEVPIILCTGFSEQIDEDSAKEMGIRAFVMKPIVMREIVKTIRQVLDKK